MKGGRTQRAAVMLAARIDAGAVGEGSWRSQGDPISSPRSPSQARRKTGNHQVLIARHAGSPRRNGGVQAVARGPLTATAFLPAARARACYRRLSAATITIPFMPGGRQ